jgi:hypothetical protein
VTLPQYPQHVGMLLADELLLLTLSPAEARNTRAHQGIRAAVCGADLLDPWLAGAVLTGDLRRHMRKHSFGALEPALGRLTAAGRIAAAPQPRALAILGARAEILLDAEHGATIRDRLRASLAGPGSPPARDAALAVLLYTGRLWNWSGLEEYSIEEVRVFGRRQLAATPLKQQAQALAEGKLLTASDTTGVLAGIAKAIDHEYIHNAD